MLKGVKVPLALIFKILTGVKADLNQHYIQLISKIYGNWVFIS
jgi:hypothetical protein